MNPGKDFGSKKNNIFSNTYLQTRGSPSYQYGLAPTNFITAVNDLPTPTLSEFLAQVTAIPDNTYFRLRVMTFDNVPWVATMKKNEHYFPTVEFAKEMVTTAGGSVDGQVKPRWVQRSFGEEGGKAGGLVSEAMDEGAGGVDSGGDF